MKEKLKNIMKEDKETKKRLGVIVVSLVLMISLVIGLTYAAFTYTSSGTQENIVSTTAVTMKYTEKTNGILLDNAMPTSDEVGKTLALDSNYAFYFTVSITTGSNTPIGYEVTAEKLTAKELFDNNLTDEDKEEDVELVKDDEVRLYLERSENNPDNYQSIMEPTAYTPLTESTPLGAQVGEMMLDFGTVSETKTYHYILRMWVGENYNVDDIERYYGVRVNVYGTDSRSYSNTLTLNKTSLEFEVGESEQITTTVTPENVTNADITWSSSDSTIAIVDTMGNVTGISTGTATITATTSKGRKATCIVTIKGKSPTAISGIEVDGSSLGDLDLTLTTDTEKIVGVNITPNDYDDITYSVTWTTSDSDIVDIEEVTEGTTGTSSNDETIIASKMASKNITAKKVKLKAGSTPGDATVTATIKNKSGGDITKSFDVKVQYPNLESITLDKSSATIDRGDTLQLNATLNPGNVNNSDLTWTSSNPEVATVSNSGVVTPVAKGTTTITVSGTTGTSTTATINVINELSSSLSFDVNQSLNVGQKHTYNAVVTPSDARDVDYITWTSSDPSIASIPEICNTNHTTSCEIEALKKGTTTITIETKDVENGSAIRTATSTLTVNELLLSTKITTLAQTDTTTLLADDGTSDHNTRYIGASPNNYVNFNCDSNGENCELWRIIGSMNNIKSSENGIGESRVKLIRNTSIGMFSWDGADDTSGGSSGWGTQNWTDSDLMKLLNPGYESNMGALSELTSNSLYYNGGSGHCFSRYGNVLSIECSFPLIEDEKDGTKVRALGSSAKLLFSDAYWNIGASTNSSETFDTLYNEERGTTSAGSGWPIYWIGKVALMYPSDYALAGYSCTKNLPFFDNEGQNDVRKCASSNWLYNKDAPNGYRKDWFLTPWVNYPAAWAVMDEGNIGASGAMLCAARTSVRPSVYLKSNVIVKEQGSCSIDGTAYARGSEQCPYNIALGS